MFKHTMQFEDLEGNPTEGTFYFNYSKLELAKMLEFDDLEARIDRLTKTVEEKEISEPENTREAWDTFEMLIAGAYGKKSEDGLEFDKSPEMTRRWKNHVAFEALIFELIQDASLAAEFVEKCLPAKLIAQAKEELKAEGKSIEDLVKEADQRQKDPETRIEPGLKAAVDAGVAPPEALQSGPILTGGKTDDELLEMPPNKMTPEQFSRAFEVKARRNAAQDS